jgi:hypothetical protein
MTCLSFISYFKSLHSNLVGGIASFSLIIRQYPFCFFFWNLSSLIKFWKVDGQYWIGQEIGKPWWLLSLLVENAHQPFGLLIFLWKRAEIWACKGVFGKTSPPDLLKNHYEMMNSPCKVQDTIDACRTWCMSMLWSRSIPLVCDGEFKSNILVNEGDVKILGAMNHVRKFRDYARTSWLVDH